MRTKLVWSSILYKKYEHVEVDARYLQMWIEGKKDQEINPKITEHEGTKKQD